VPKVPPSPRTTRFGPMKTCLEITAEKCRCGRAPLGQSQRASRSPPGLALLGERFPPFPPSHASSTQGPVRLSPPGIAHLCVKHVFGQIQLSKHLFSNRVPLDMPPLNHPRTCAIAGDVHPIPSHGRLCSSHHQALLPPAGITKLHWFPAAKAEKILH
jgi:hypothetical protein